MTLKEHIDEIRDNLEKGLYTNEAAVSNSIVRRLLDALDWPVYNPQVIMPEYSVDGRRVDFALCHPSLSPLIFIEVKQVGNIEGAERQLFEYAFHEGVPITILTDGREWHFFHPSGQGDYKERRVYKLDLIARDSEESAKRLNRYLNYQSVRTGDAVRAIEEDYRDVSRQRQVATRLPEAWGKLVEEADEFLLDVVAEKVESLCRYRPTAEQVLDFLKSLKSEIELGKGAGSLIRNPGLFVTMPDGKTVNHSTSADTFAEVIEKLGIERVRNLKRKVGRLSLISTSKDPILSQRQSGQYYIMTNTNTKRKKALLEEIATDLRELLKVEIINKS